MIVNFVGLKEPGNFFKKKVAALFGCPVFSFEDAASLLYDSMSDIYGGPKVLTTKTKDELKILVRDNITAVHHKFFADWMSQRLVDELFKKDDNTAKKLQAIILDIVTPWEYRVFKTFLVNNSKVCYGAPKRANKVILIENEGLYGMYYNKGYDDYLSYEVDATLSTEDENLEEQVKALLAKWTVAECKRQ